MATPLTPGSAPVVSEFLEQAPSITREILEGYLKCRTKAHLKLRGEHGTKSDYEVLAVETCAELRIRAAEKLASKYKPEHVMRGVTIAETVLRSGAEVILGSTVEFDDLSLCCDALKKAKGQSRLGGYHYVPVLVYEGEKIRAEQKRVLQVFGLAVGEAQGRHPDFGLIVHGTNLATRRVSFRAGLGDARRIVEEIKLLRGAGQPPRLTLNDHCQVCEFCQRCRSEAIAADDISLLSGMGERAIKKCRKKGINTLEQLSRTFRPRRKSKREVKNRRPHSFGLQAQAVHDGRIYVHGTPSFASGTDSIFLDIEGDPDRDFVYLLGMIVVADGEEKRFSFWADAKDKEKEIFNQFMDVMENHKTAAVYHYGSYEARFLKKMRREAPTKKRIDQLTGRLVNVLASIYGCFYFPTYSNGLKDVASTLGFTWTEKNASGVLSLVWRRRWEQGGRDEFKNKLVEYNLEDCAALKIVTERIRLITTTCKESSRGLGGGADSPGIPWANVTDALSNYQKWSRIRFACPDFDFINKCSYFDYQQQRVHIRTGAAKRSTVKAKQPLGKPRISQRVRLTARKCPACGGTSIFRSGARVYKKLVYDLKITVSGIRRRVVECGAQLHRCRDCGKGFLPRRFKRLDTFSHSLKSWAMYMHIVHQVSFPKIETMFGDIFGLKIDHVRAYRYKVMMASYYSPTVARILRNLVSGAVIYADETEVKLKNSKGYVWILSNTEEVLYLYRPSREVDFLKDLLGDFKGVLVTDFYPAYDSLGCLQQKCLVHLMRDLNEALLGNPFDEEFKHFAFEFGKLLKSIVTTIDKHGLKQRHLSRHRRDVDRFYEEVIQRVGESEATAVFRERFLKYRGELFRFLDHDGVAWNNNYAEHAIKEFAHYRVRADGNVNESGLNAYLTLLSVYQTCKNKEVRLLDFFLSGERDIDKFRRLGRNCRRPFSLDVFPKRFYIPWPKELYTTSKNGGRSQKPSRP